MMGKDSKKSVKDDQKNILDDSKINVLVMGVSGSGKSTLINSILGEEKAPTGDGAAVTPKMAVYEADGLPFRLIDTVGFEYDIFRQIHIKNEIAKWSKDCVKKKDTTKLIHIIWFCVDGQCKRVFTKTLDYLLNASKIWKDIPIIVVFTKSYSISEIQTNEKMFYDVLSKYKKNENLNVRCTLPVVANEVQIDDLNMITPRGLDELINKTNNLIPDAKKLNELAVKDINLRLKRAMANGLVGTAVVGATVIGAVPITIPDSMLLLPLQSGMLWGIGKIYGINNNSAENEVISTILKVGATTAAGKALVSMLKMIPGINVAAAVINAIAAGTITFTAGEISITIFEKVVKGEIDMTNIDWMKYITMLFNDKLAEYGKQLQRALQQENAEDVLKNLVGVLSMLKET